MNKLTQTINFDEAMAFLNSASLHELYRLSMYINNAMASPERIAQVKQALQIGQMIQFVEPDTNNTREGTLMKMNPKYASIYCHDDNRYWQIPYYMLVVHARLVTVNTGYEAGTLNRNNIKVGENLGFDHNGQTQYGKVLRLNQKTVSIESADNRRWRVPYRLLFKVHEGEYHKTSN